MEFRLNLVQRYKLAVKRFILSSNHSLYFSGIFCVCNAGSSIWAAGTYDDMWSGPHHVFRIVGEWTRGSISKRLVLTMLKYVPAAL